MIDLLIAINTTILLFLSSLHIYWAFGGRWSKQSALPAKLNGELALNPSNAGTFVVGIGLFVFACITVSNIGLVDQWMDRSYIRIATLVIAVVFCLRAIGDFKYVGLMKSIKGTEFAKKDTRIYIPICIILSLCSTVILM